MINHFVPYLGGWWHDQKLHGFPEVQMQVSVANSHKADDLFAVNIPNDELACFRISVYFDLGESLASLSDEMDWLIIDSEICMRNVSELYPLIKHVHSRVECCVDVVCHVIFSHPLFVDKRGHLNSTSSSVDR
jgi:hypothetical protein